MCEMSRVVCKRAGVTLYALSCPFLLAGSVSTATGIYHDHELYSSWMKMYDLKFEEAHQISSALSSLETVKRDGARLSMSLACFRKNAFAAAMVPGTAQMRFHRFAACIHHAAQIHPWPANLNIRFVAAP
jgi:hypothetical protein